MYPHLGSTQELWQIALVATFGKDELFAAIDLKLSLLIALKACMIKVNLFNLGQEEYDSLLLHHLGAHIVLQNCKHLCKSCLNPVQPLLQWIWRPSW